MIILQSRLDNLIIGVEKEEDDLTPATKENITFGRTEEDMDG